MTAGTVDVVIQHNSMQFSDDRDQHEHDVNVVFDLAVDTGSWMIGGTEAGDISRKHDLHDLIIDIGEGHDFYVFAHKYGEWVALNKRYMHNFGHEYMGPFIEGTHGISAPQGAHSPRGVTVGYGEARQHSLGQLAFAEAHYMTHRSEAVSGSNEPLYKGIAEYGRMYGSAHKKAFMCADANERDDHVDVFHGRPFTTISDELNKKFKTHGINTHRGTQIDYIASYDSDGGVKGKEFEVWDDSDHKLFSDHFILHAVYGVKES